MRFLSLGSLLVGGLFSLSAVASDGAAFLQRLAQAERTQSFSGTFVYERNGSFSSHSVWHQVASDGVVRERLLQLDGAAKEVVRVDGQVQCASGMLADQLTETQLRPGRELEPAKLSQWYDLRILGESRVAGRATTVLALVPRDQYRHGIELHLDQQTGLAVKSLLVNDKGQLLERFQFTHFQVGDVVTDALLPGAGCRPVRTAPAASQSAQVWSSQWLPPGFTLSSASPRRSPASDESVACQVYDDGLARFSVFIEPLNDATAEDVRSQLGPTVAVSRRLKTNNGDVMVTVIGEIPLGTAERIALSIRSPGEAMP